MLYFVRNGWPLIIWYFIVEINPYNRPSECTLCTWNKLGRQLLSNRNSVLQGPTFTCISICDEFKCVQVISVISCTSQLYMIIRNCVKTDKFIICASALMSQKNDLHTYRVLVPPVYRHNTWYGIIHKN